MMLTRPTYYNWQDDQVLVAVTCQGPCKERFEVIVPASAVVAHNNGKGAAVQDAYPMLSPDQRDLFFQSGLCVKCWDHLMGNNPFGK